MPLPLALLMAPQILKTAYGGLQTIMGQKRLGELERPTRSTSPAVKEGVARARYGAQAGERPGAEVGRAAIATGQAGAVSQIQKAGGTSGSTMAAALGAQKQAGRANIQESVLDEQYSSRMNTQYLQQLQQLAQEQQMNFQWNQAQKFQEDAGAAKALQESGMQNLIGGISEGVGVGVANQLNAPDNESSPFWNAKKGYMGTAEKYQADQGANVAQWQKQLMGGQSPAASNPMHGKFGEGMNTEGWMNPMRNQMIKLPLQPIPQYGQ